MENGFCIRVVQSIKLGLIVTFTNLEYKARERQRTKKEKVGGRPAKLNEKKGDRDLQREIKNKQTKEDIFCRKNNMKIL